MVECGGGGFGFGTEKPPPSHRYTSDGGVVSVSRKEFFGPDPFSIDSRAVFLPKIEN